MNSIVKYLIDNNLIFEDQYNKKKINNIIPNINLIGFTNNVEAFDYKTISIRNPVNEPILMFSAIDYIVNLGYGSLDDGIELKILYNGSRFAYTFLGPSSKDEWDIIHNGLKSHLISVNKLVGMLNQEKVDSLEWELFYTYDEEFLLDD